MSHNNIKRAAHPARRNQPVQFRLTPFAAAVAAVAFLAAGGVQAQEKSSAELQAEVARLRLALEKAQQELQKKDGIVAPTATADVLRVSESDRSDTPDFEAALQHLDAVARRGSLLEIQHALTQLIPSYAPYPDSSRSPSGEYPGV